VFLFNSEVITCPEITPFEFSVIIIIHSRILSEKY
jgi:hypothetical protein